MYKLKFNDFTLKKKCDLTRLLCEIARELFYGFYFGILSCITICKYLFFKYIKPSLSKIKKLKTLSMF